MTDEFVPKLNWQNSPSTATPITASELLRIENGLLWLKEIKPRAKTAAEWTADNDILGVNEYGLETDTLMSKIGDGGTAWNSLVYSDNPLQNVGTGTDLSLYLKVADAVAGYAEIGHTHTSAGGGNLASNGDFSASGLDWDTTNKVGSPVVTYETSPLDTGLAAKMVFAAAGNEQVFESTVLEIPGDDINGLSGSFVAHSTKPCTYSVELLTSSTIVMDPDYGAQAENLTIAQVVAATTVANDDTPVTWSVVFPPDAVKARIAVRIKAGAGQTTPITAYLDDVAYTWAAGAVSTTTPQAQGVVATLSTDQLNVASATPTKLLLDSPIVDRGGYFDAANHQLVVPSLCSGLHTFHAQIPFELNTTLFRRVVLKVNTVEVTSNEIRASATHPCVVPVHYVNDLKNGDVLELFVEHDSGVPLDILASGMNVSIVREDRQPQSDVGPPVLPPVAGFTVTPTTGTAPRLVTCTSTATGDISSITYNYGDGSGELTSPTHTYQGAYSGNITQTVTGPGGTSTFTRSVNISGVVVGDVALVKSQQITAKTDAATSVVAALPTGGGAPVTGDKMVLWAIQRGATVNISVPAGYTSMGAQYVGTNAVARAFHKTAGASEAAPTVVSDSNNAMVVGVLVFTDQSWKTTDPWSVDWIAEGVSAATNNYNQPAVTTQDNNALHVGIVGQIYSATVPTLTIPEGYTGRGAQVNGVETSVGQHISTRVATEVVPTAGNAGVAIWTSTNSAVWIGMQFAVTAKNAVPPQPVGTDRFPGDPGIGKIYTTWIQHGGNYDIWKDQLALIRGVAYPNGAADASRNSGLFKIYDAGHPNPMSDHVAVVQDGRIPFITYNLTKATAAPILQGDWDARLDADIATLNNWRNNYNAVVWTNLLHEPEDNLFTTKADRQMAREAQRYYVDYMRSGGSAGLSAAPTNLAFVGPVFIASTLGDAVYDFNNGNVRGAPWWEYDPNWRGPEAGPTGYTGYTGWSATSTEVKYNPVDFYTGANKYADIAGCDLYCFHWQHTVGQANPAGWDPSNGGSFDNFEEYYWSSNPNPANFVTNSGHMLSFEGHAPFDRDHYNSSWDNGTAFASGQQHGGERYRMALDRIYGTGADRQPIFIAEAGWPIFQNNNTMDPDWSITFAHYQFMLQSLVDNGVVGFCWWKSDNPADVRQATIDDDTISTCLGTKQTQKNPIVASGFTASQRTAPGYPLYAYQAKYDSTDTRRKLFAWWQDSTLQKKKLRR